MISKLYKILLILLVFFSHAVICKSQHNLIKVSGFVLDKLSFKAVSGASIIFQKSEGNQVTCLSDTLGRFETVLTTSGKYQVSISLVSYKKVIITDVNVNRDTILEPLYLEADVTDLSVVTITAKYPTIKQLFDKLIVSVANTSLTANGNVFNLLQKLPGVQVQQDGLILLKGKLVEVWIDNRPTNLTGVELKNYLNSLVSSSIDKVELISNPSVKFDAAASAIINIKTIRLKKAGFNGTVNIGMAHGEYFRTYDGLNLNYQSKKLSIYGSYSISYEKENLSYRSVRETLFGTAPGTIQIHDSTAEKRTNQQARLGLDYQLNSKSSIGFLLNAGFNKSGSNSRNFTSLFISPASIDSMIVLDSRPSARFENPSVNLYYNLSLDTVGTLIRINADYWKYSQMARANYTNYFYDPNGQQFKNPFLLRTYLPAFNEIRAIKLDLETPFRKGTIMGGIKIAASKRDNDLRWENYNDVTMAWQTDNLKTNHFIFNENIYAFYFGYEKEFKKINLQIICRAEKTVIKGVSLTNNTSFKQDYFKFFPSVALDYNISDKNQFSFSYRKSINRPVFSYLDPFNIFISQYSTLKGNPQLKPQIVHSFEISHSYKQTYFTTFTYSETIKAVSRIYQKDNNTNVLTTTYDNLDKFSNYSLDFSFSKLLKPFWFVSFNSTAFYTNVNTTTGNTKVKNNSFGFNATMFNNFSLPKSLSIDVFMIYAAPFASTVFKYKNSSFINIGFHMPVLKGKGTLNLFVSDIFKTARTNYSTRQNGINLTYNRVYDDRYGNISLNYRFGSKKLKQVRERKTGIETEKTRMKNITQ